MKKVEWANLTDVSTIRKMLEKQRFREWYESKFAAYLETGLPSDKEIEADLEKLLEGQR